MDQYKHRPLIFIHLPKTAGTSLRYLLASQTMCRIPLDVSTLPTGWTDVAGAIQHYGDTCWMSLKGWVGKHSTIEPDEHAFEWSMIFIPNEQFWNKWLYDVEDKFINEIVEVHLNDVGGNWDSGVAVPSDLCENKLYYDFDWLTVIRNPVERLISEYYFINDYRDPTHLFGRQRSAWGGGTQNRWDMSQRFWGHLNQEYINDVESYNNLKETQNTQTKYLLGKGFLNDYEVTEEDYYKVINTLDSLNFKVGIFELLPDTIEYFNKSFGFTMRYKDMQNKRSNWDKPRVSQEIKEVIKENNKWDIKLYNYYFDKFNKINI